MTLQALHRSDIPSQATCILHIYPREMPSAKSLALFKSLGLGSPIDADAIRKERFSIQRMIEHPRYLKNRFDYFALCCLSITSVALLALGMKNYSRNTLFLGAIQIQAGIMLPILMAFLRSEGPIKKQLHTAKEVLIQLPKLLCQSIMLGALGTILGKRALQEISMQYDQKNLQTFKQYLLAKSDLIEKKLQDRIDFIEQSMEEGLVNRYFEKHIEEYKDAFGWNFYDYENALVDLQSLKRFSLR